MLLFWGLFMYWRPTSVAIRWSQTRALLVEQPPNSQEIRSDQKIANKDEMQSSCTLRCPFYRHIFHKQANFHKCNHSPFSTWMLRKDTERTKGNGGVWCSSLNLGFGQSSFACSPQPTTLAESRTPIRRRSCATTVPNSWQWSVICLL